EPLTYQWRFNTWVDLPGATNSTLTLTNLQLNDCGTYSVVVSNCAGGSASATLLTVMLPPVYLGEDHPCPDIVPPYFQARWQLATIASTPYTVEWRVNGSVMYNRLVSTPGSDCLSNRVPFNELCCSMNTGTGGTFFLEFFVSNAVGTVSQSSVLIS